MNETINSEEKEIKKDEIHLEMQNTKEQSSNNYVKLNSDNKAHLDKKVTQLKKSNVFNQIPIENSVKPQLGSPKIHQKNVETHSNNKILDEIDNNLASSRNNIIQQNLSQKQTNNQVESGQNCINQQIKYMNNTDHVLQQIQNKNMDNTHEQMTKTEGATVGNKNIKNKSILKPQVLNEDPCGEVDSIQESINKMNATNRSANTLKSSARSKQLSLLNTFKTQFVQSIRGTNEQMYYPIKDIESKIIRFVFGFVALFALVCDIEMAVELESLLTEKWSKDEFEMQFYLFIGYFVASLVLGHFSGLQQPIDPLYFNNKYLRSFTALLGCMGLSPIFYYFLSAIKQQGMKEYDRFMYVNWGSRRVWAHWHSVLSCFLSSHYLFTSDKASFMVVLGFIFNTMNVLFAFIEHEGYENNQNADHISCINCCCEGNQSMTQVRILEEQQKKLKKKKCTNYLECKNLLVKDNFTHFYSCGCEDHQLFLCQFCENQKKDHRDESLIVNIFNKNKFYIFLIPEIIGRPLFIGALSLVLIEKSPIFDQEPIRLAYDFLFWNAIGMITMLFIPYIYYILTSEHYQSLRPASIMILYTYYYTQFLRTPFKNCTIKEQFTQILMTREILQQRQTIETQSQKQIQKLQTIMEQSRKEKKLTPKQIKEQEELQKEINNLLNDNKKNLNLDNFGGLLQFLTEGDGINIAKFNFLLKYYPRAVKFLGIFPAFWRILEVIAISTLIFTDFATVNNSSGSHQSIVYLTLFFNFLSVFTLIYFVRNYYRLSQNLYIIQKKFESDENNFKTKYKKKIENETNGFLHKLNNVVNEHTDDNNRNKKLTIIQNQVQRKAFELQQKEKEQVKKEIKQLTKNDPELMKSLQVITQQILDKNANTNLQDTYTELSQQNDPLLKNEQTNSITNHIKQSKIANNKDLISSEFFDFEDVSQIENNNVNIKNYQFTSQTVDIKQHTIEVYQKQKDRSQQFTSMLKSKINNNETSNSLAELQKDKQEQVFDLNTVNTQNSDLKGVINSKFMGVAQSQKINSQNFTSDMFTLQMFKSLNMLIHETQLEQQNPNKQASPSTLNNIQAIEERQSELNQSNNKGTFEEYQDHQFSSNLDLEK